LAIACLLAVADGRDVAVLGTVKLATGSENEDVSDALPTLECQCEELKEMNFPYVDWKDAEWFGF
jgi:hypothetical protein